MAIPKYVDADTRRYVVSVILLLAAVLYFMTCAPGLLWQDSAVFQHRVWRGDYEGGMGLALAHPLYIGLARTFSLVPWESHSFRVNLFSGLCAAICLALLADLMLSVTKSITAAVTAAVLLGVSHTFWKHSVIAEVMSLYGLGLVAELWLLERFISRKEAGWFAAALFVNGLNTSNHVLALLHLPAYGFLVIWALGSGRLKIRHLFAGLLAYCAGLSPYLTLIVREILDGRPQNDVIRSALFGEVFEKDVLNTSLALTRNGLRTAQYFVLNFPTPLLLAAPIGWIFALWNSPTRWFAAFGGTLFIVAFAFAFRYPVADQYVFFFPCYILTAAFVGLAVPLLVGRSVFARLACLAFALVPAVAYEYAPELVKRAQIVLPFRQDVPFRDAHAYYLRPRMNGDNSAHRFARAALSEPAPDGLLIADFSVNTALVYARDISGIERSVTLTLPSDLKPARPALETSPESVRPFAERGAAFIVSNRQPYAAEWILRDYDLVPSGVVFKLVPKGLRATSDAANRRGPPNPSREISTFQPVKHAANSPGFSR
jgi:hypothetical protein